MYNLEPKAVFAHRRVYEKPEAVERMCRILEALRIDEQDVDVVDLADVPRIVDAAGATDDLTRREVTGADHGRVRQGQFRIDRDPVLVFNTFVWDEAERLLGIVPGETTADGKYSLEEVNCVGACAMAPLVIKNEQYHGKFKPIDVKKLLGPGDAE